MASSEASAVGEDAGPIEAHHPRDVSYIVIAVWLAVLTAVEVALSYVELWDLNVPLLLILMVVKFGIVAAYFMHLKLDNRLLTQLFVAGLVLAVSVYLAVLLAFEWF